MERKIMKPKCINCEYYLYHKNTMTKKVKGMLLRPGGRYCTGAKKIRQFKPKDPKVYPPSWCPRYKYPTELKIYCYKDLNAAMFRSFIRNNGLNIMPSGHEYALRYQGSSPVSASEFQKRQKEEYIWNILPESVQPHEVIEIDDGIVPYYFYVTEEKVECISFDREKALQNVLEQPGNMEKDEGEE